MRGIGIVETEYGKVRGEEQNGITVFRSLPFAKAPIGELRFRAPRACEPWEGVRDCLTFGNIPWQPEGWVGKPSLMAYPQDEDCLTLSIWTPAESSNEKLPVMVWIHGGGFMGGVSHEDLFDGTQFAKKGVIFVSISYRLGAFGFLALPELRKEGEGSGNFGFLDQIFALKWIKKNIRGFGGDPGRITIVGQSAGAMSVSALLTSNLTKGLISGAIMQSTGPTWDRENHTEDSEKIGLAFMEAAGAKNLEELRAMPAEKLRDLSGTDFMKGEVPWLLFTPTVDGKILPMTSHEAFLKGEIANVPIIIGTNSDEGRSRTDFLKNKETAMDSIREGAPAFVADFEKLYEKDSARAATIAEGVQEFSEQRSLLRAMYESPGVSEVYHYYFSKAVLLQDGTDIGATHSMELFYVFNVFAHWESDVAEENQFSHAGKIENHLLSCNMEDYWVAFVKNGTPNAPGLAEWKSAKDGSFMHFDNSKGVLRKELKLDELHYWKNKLR